MTLKQEYLMLAHTRKSENIEGWLASVKLNGNRAWWDGGITRGMKKHLIPWANCAKDHGEQISTGLWSRYGNVIHAPNEWLDQLPHIMLDGELYITGSARQDIRSIVSKQVASVGTWHDVTYNIFDAPPAKVILKDRVIDNINHHAVLKGCYKWALPLLKNLDHEVSELAPFRSRYLFLKKHTDSDIVRFIPQDKITLDSALELLDTVTSKGGEGIVVRYEYGLYDTVRSKHLLKMKKYFDSEATIIGYTTGRDGKYRGMIGALIVEWEGKVFKLNGMDDWERPLSDTIWAENNPESEVPAYITGVVLPRGTRVTFRYMELSKDGIPQEARYLNVRGEEE